MNDGDALLRAIFDNPAEDTPRLEYADWLDENDRGIRDLGLRAWFIRWQILGDTRGDTHNRIPYNLGWFVDKRHLWSADRLSRTVYTAAGNSDQSHPKFGDYSWNPNTNREVYTETNGFRLVYRRGFPDEVWVTTAAFLSGAAELFAKSPITKVRLTDKKAEHKRHKPGGHYRLTWFRDGAWGEPPPNHGEDEENWGADGTRGTGCVIPLDLWPDPTRRRYNFQTKELANKALSDWCVFYGWKTRPWFDHETQKLWVGRA